jgi:asparagine synthase (glutamine-hydrolysing)
MCGICGIINYDKKPVTESSIRGMMKAMKHRGPDDEGVFMKDNIGLGFVRLSILDLSSAGHQPMFSADGRFVIVFNGEIYNYIELREILKQSYTFKSNTDTEVLLAAWMKWGSDCLHLLNGMFAFAILDIVSNIIFAARDRFGIKPFYYLEADNSFVFGSDIPSVLASVRIKAQADESAIFDFLLFNRTNHTEKTFFRGITKLPHGSCMTITGDKAEIKRWYNLRNRIYALGDQRFNDSDFLEEFKNSINLQLRSDVPVGTCLSGGLDSSAITSMVLLNKKDVDLHSFSAVYQPGQRGDESEYIKEYHQSNLKVHYTCPTEESLLEDMDLFIASQAEPVPSTSIYAEYCVMKIASNYCTVLLNGQGADEMMAGYHYFFGYHFKDLLKEMKWGSLLNEMYCYSKIHLSLTGIKTMGFAFNPRSLRHFKNHHFIDKRFYNDFYNKENILFDRFYNSKSLKEFLINHFEYKFEHNLLWADKTGMSFSIESRFPFLDHHLVEKTLSVSTGNYIKNGYTKAIMRNALKGILPERIRMRTDKVGFSTPEGDWFNQPGLQNILSDVIFSASFSGRGFFNVDYCKQQLELLKKYNKYNLEMWKWLHLELWFRKYID